ncbi:hypothetical protein ATO6_16970 [Oceanicola sp. 22II-s10i]|nr:hypothetical protein ATO6_16970 [Oceanicola sp. 22II-s10i]
MREMVSGFANQRRLAVLATVVVILTMLGPFGTYEAMPPGRRSLFWSLIVLGISVPMHIAMCQCLVADMFRDWPRPRCIALGSAIAAVPGAFIVFLVCALLWPRHMTLEAYALTYVQVAVMGSAIGLVQYMQGSFDTVTPRPDSRRTPAEHHPSEPVAFHRRLTPDTGTDILSLTMQDHYVQVSTTRGVQMVLIRLSDAIAELEGVDGMQVHRSHWIALPHAVRMERKDGKDRVILSDGRDLPVSRTYAKALRKRLEARG